MLGCLGCVVGWVSGSGGNQGKRERKSLANVNNLRVWVCVSRANGERERVNLEKGKHKEKKQLSL